MEQRLSFVAILGLLVAAPLWVQAQVTTPDQQTFLEHVTSYRFLARGVRAQEAGQLGLAYDNYMVAARDANKPAQFKLGLMYLDGAYVEYDPARAWAWMAVSAEREYPQFAEVADQLWNVLPEPERERALVIFEEELRPAYGDARTVPRVATQMRRERNKATGSRVSQARSARVVTAKSGTQSGKGVEMNSADFLNSAAGQQRDGLSFFDHKKWDFNEIVGLETNIVQGLQWGHATIRDTERQDGDEDTLAED